MLLDFGTLRAEIEIETLAAACIRLEQTAEHPQKRRLAAAVRAEKAVNLAVTDLHRDVIHDRAVAEFFCDAAHVNDEFTGAHASRRDFHVHRLAGTKFRRVHRRKFCLNHENQFRAVLAII